MNHIFNRTHYCMNCGMELVDELHPSDSPICACCSNDLKEEAMTHIPLETHRCMICGVEFEDEIHPNDDELCLDCLWEYQFDLEDLSDEIVMAETAYAAYFRGEE